MVKLLREAGVYCIQNVNALNIVQIVEERLHIPKIIRRQL